MTVAEIIQHYVATSGSSVVGLADKAKVNRIFLTRLAKGQRPARARSGRLPARSDARYQRLATAMELDVAAFIAQVEAEQPKDEPDLEATVIHKRRVVKLLIMLLPGTAVYDLDDCQVEVKVIKVATRKRK